MQENFLVRCLHHYGLDWESPFTKHVYETEVTSVKLNMVYLHMWLLKYHLNNPFKDKAYIKEQMLLSRHNAPRTKVRPSNIAAL